MKRNDYGVTLGGPVIIPKLYNGKDKTFFFFNFEQFRQTTVTNNGLATMPTPAYEGGNFAAAEAPYLSFLNSDGAIPNHDLRSGHQAHRERRIRWKARFRTTRFPSAGWTRWLCISRRFFPSSEHLGRRAAEQLRHPGLFQFPHTTIPSIKIDQALNSKMKLSGYFSLTETNSPNTNGFSQNLAPVAPTADRSYTYRLNFDDTLTPTLLFHFGVGLLYYDHPDLYAALGL